MSNFEYAKESIRGQRKNQEDTCDFYFQPAPNKDNLTNHQTHGKLLAVLADGMGGHVGGAFASRLVCSSFISNYSDQNSFDEPQKLTDTTHKANQIIQEKITEDQSLKGMGSTLVSATFEEDNLYWVSVGDSLIYLYRNNQITQLNEEHSYYQDLLKQVEMGIISLEQAQTHPQKNAITSAIMGIDIKHIDAPKAPFKLLPGDWVILASDGILTLSEDNIASLITANKHLGTKVVIKELLDKITREKKSNQDNATIMAIKPILKNNEIKDTQNNTTLITKLMRSVKSNFSLSLFYSTSLKSYDPNLTTGFQARDFSYRFVLNKGQTEC